MRFTRITLLSALVALVVVPAALAIRFTDDSFNIPPAYVGQPYTKQFDGRGGCGPALPYQYTIIGGALPPGLSLSLSGLISSNDTFAALVRSVTSFTRWRTSCVAFCSSRRLR